MSTDTSLAVESFNVGDLVMFRNRCQTTAAGMRVEQVDTGLFGTRLKVDGKWWVPQNFMRHSAWVEKHRPSAV